jgi:hypothetical protein
VESHRSLLFNFVGKGYDKIDVTSESFGLLISNLGNGMLVAIADWLDRSKVDVENLDYIIEINTKSSELLFFLMIFVLLLFNLTTLIQFFHAESKMLKYVRTMLGFSSLESKKFSNQIFTVITDI